AITEPDHPGSVFDTLLQCFEPQTRRKGLHVPQDGYHPARCAPGDDVSSPRAMLVQTGQHTHFECAPADCAPGAPGDCTTWHHRPIRPQGPGPSRLCSRHWLGHRLVTSAHGSSLLLEVLHGVAARCLYPTPHSPSTNSATGLRRQTAQREPR